MRERERERDYIHASCNAAKDCQTSPTLMKRRELSTQKYSRRKGSKGKKWRERERDLLRVNVDWEIEGFCARNIKWIRFATIRRRDHKAFREGK